MSLPTTGTTTTTTLSSDYSKSNDLMDKLLQNPIAIGELWQHHFRNDDPTSYNEFTRLFERFTGHSLATTNTDHHPQAKTEEPIVFVREPPFHLSHEQIANSPVLNMADVEHNSMSGLERFFSGTDMHSVINYLWVGIVISLIVLTVIFVVFSCYFYRKFREWKKCNKDIRANLSSGSINSEAAYYQVESPPCYTIATGLPTYDEALHNNQENFAFGMKFIYPTLAAVHHQATNLISSWEKYDGTSKEPKANNNATTTTKCKTAHSVLRNIKSSQASSSSLSALNSSITLEASTATSATSALLLPPSYEVVGAGAGAAAVAVAVADSTCLPPEQVLVCDNFVINMSQLDTNASEKTSSDLTDILTV